MGAKNFGRPRLPATMLLISLLALLAMNPVFADWDNARQALISSGITPSRADILVERAQAREIGPEQVQQWADIVAEGISAGLPPDPFAERTLQGLIKGVPAPRIERSLRQLRENLTWSRDVIEFHVPLAERRAQPDIFEDALKEMDGALRSGLSRSTLEGMFPLEPLALDQVRSMVESVTALRGAGMPNGDAAHLMRAAASNGLTGGELRQLRRDLIAEIRRRGITKPTLHVVEGLLQNLGHKLRLGDRLGSERTNEFRERLREPTQRNGGLLFQ
jgi:hypothetical protein